MPAARANAALDFTPRSYVGYRHSFLLGDDRLDVGAFWTNTDFENSTPFARFFYNNTDYGVALRHEINGTLFDARNRFVWGLNVADGKSENDTFGPLFFGDFEAEPNPGKFQDIREDRTTVEVFAQEQWYVTPRFSLLAGGQYAYAKRENRVEVPTPPTFFPIFFPQDEEQTYHGFNPKLGAIFGSTDAVQVFANVSRSFEPPNSFEFFSSSGDLLEARGRRRSARAVEPSASVGISPSITPGWILSIETRPTPDSSRPTTWTTPRISASRQAFPPYCRSVSRRSTMRWT